MADSDRLIKFMRDEAANADDERESWFNATADELNRLKTALSESEIPLDALQEAMGDKL